MKIRIFLLILVVFASALTGGIAAQLIFHPQIAEAQQNRDHIRAQSFQVVDEQGRVCGLFGTIDGCTQLTIFDTRGTRRISLSLTPGGCPLISILGPDEKARIGIGMPIEGEPCMLLFNSNGQLAFGLLHTDRVTGFAFYDENQVLRAILGAVPGQQPSLLFRDEMNELLWSAP